MLNPINNLSIKNFKSVKDLKMDCKRINVIIGKPNVGKSNILEAISLLNPLHLPRNNAKFLSDFIRYEDLSNLFYDDKIASSIEITADNLNTIINWDINNHSEDSYIFLNGDQDFLSQIKNQNNFSIDEFNSLKKQNRTESSLNPFYAYIEGAGRVLNNSLPLSNLELKIKKYTFKTKHSFPSKFNTFLLPPHGENLLSIIENNIDLKKEIGEIFSQYGLEFVIYKKGNVFEIQKNQDGIVNKYNYTSIADTFQRFIFYLAVIDSNNNSCIVLEEPEVHSFPPYTKELSDRIIDSTENQFFITTHSPYLLENLISNLDYSELNLSIAYYEDYETKLYSLTQEDLKRASDFGIDLFYNLDEFIK